MARRRSQSFSVTLRARWSLCAFVACAACGGQETKSAARPSPVLRAVPAYELRTTADFAPFVDRAERSRALFLELSRVLLHPRCANCHPSGDVPLQGMEAKPHDPPVVRGAEDRGAVGMECAGCHQEHNLEHARVPGAKGWHLAPLSMAWVGRSPRDICEQLKDPERNGHKTLVQIIDHNGRDALVAWGWQPGSGREPAPGSQARFGELTRAWVETGAECPSAEARP
jgi:hypothetical protein